MKNEGMPEHLEPTQLESRITGANTKEEIPLTMPAKIQRKAAKTPRPQSRELNITLVIPRSLNLAGMKLPKRATVTSVQAMLRRIEIQAIASETSLDLSIFAPLR